jgi:uncharacterized repeat protein (TIGR03803 family)
MQTDRQRPAREPAWSRRALAATACWLGSALLTGALAAANGYQVVASLTREQGSMLNGAPVQDAAGALYLTARIGGADDLGSIVRIGLEGEVTVLRSFDDRRKHHRGHTPQHGLILADDGYFYGSTMAGGRANQGTIFRLSPQGELQQLHWLDRARDGAFPSKLLRASDGNFYGTTPSGGANERGTVFRLTPGGEFKVVHHFSGLPEEPAHPTAELIQARDGLLYGTSPDGGFGGGTVFRLRLDGSALTVLHRFVGPDDGRFPETALIEGQDGNFYGTTRYTRSVGDTGVAYRVTPAGEYTVLHVFDEERDGAQPDGALIQGRDGDFHGTTTTGGPRGGGTVFRMKPDGRVDVLHGFNGRAGRSNGPRGALLLGQDGLLYGSTGHFTAPVVFRVRPK